MMRSFVAISITVYLFIPFRLFGRFFCRMVTKWVGLGRVRPEFHVNFGSGRVYSLHLWVGLGRVKKMGPMSNHGGNTVLTKICRKYCNLLPCFVFI